MSAYSKDKDKDKSETLEDGKEAESALPEKTGELWLEKDTESSRAEEEKDAVRACAEIGLATAATYGRPGIDDDEETAKIELERSKPTGEAGAEVEVEVEDTGAMPANVVTGNATGSGADGADEEAPLPLARLSRSSRMTPQEQPGAYRAQPGQAAVRLGGGRISQAAEDEFEHEGENPNPPSEAATPQTVLSRATTDSLVQARTVHAGEDTQSQFIDQADPIDEADLQRREAKRRQTTLNLLLRLIVGFMVLIAVILCIVFLLPKKHTDNQDSKPFLGNETTTSPTQATSNAVLLPQLPDYSIQAIVDPTSPQALAQAWLLNDPNFETYNQQRILQRFALATLAYATNSTSWITNTSWLSYHQHECTWHGNKQHDVSKGAITLIITSDSPCDNTVNYYERLLLGSNGLVGTIPLEIYALPNLTNLELQYNLGLKGSISSHIGLLTNLEHFTARSCSFTSSLPTEMGALSNLETIYLDFNRFMMNLGFSGAIPTEIGRLTSLRRLDFGFNSFNRTIPQEIFNLSRIKAFALLNNFFTGSIPTGIGGMTSVQYFNIGYCNLTGPVPSEVGLMSSLFEWDSGRNHHSGTLPSEMGTLPLIRRIALQGCGLLLPSELGLLTVLDTLSATENNITSVPSEIGKISTLIQLHLNQNQIAVLPSELGSMSKLTILEVAGNLLAIIPSELGMLTSDLKILEFSQNSLQTIPSEIGRLGNSLQQLFLSNNPLHYDDFPDEFWSLSSLELLTMDNVSIVQQPIPTLIGKLTNLTSFVSRDAGWTGQLPTEIFQMHEQLQSLNVGGNALTGTLPTELGLFTNMRELAVDANYYSGTIPTEIGRMTALELFYGQDNYFTGLLPVEFGELGSMKMFNVSENQLSGTIPSELCALQEGFRIDRYRTSKLGFDCSPSLCGCDCSCSGGRI